MNDWNIQSRAHHCQACGKSFVDKHPYHTLLFDEKQQYLRQDICVTCWHAQYSQATERKGFLSHWQGTYEAPPAVPEPIHRDTAESLLRKLVALGDPKYTAASFILAVMLERKRLLKVKEQIIRGGQRTFIYEHAKTGDVFTIPDPSLQLTQLDQVQHDVAALLEHGLPEAESPPLEAAPAGVAPAEAVAEVVTPPAQSGASAEAEAVTATT